MSKWIEENPDGTMHTEIEDPEACAWMYNEVCCNDQSPYVADWPLLDFCDRCPLFTPEVDDEKET